jgi:hypothetical protein
MHIEQYCYFFATAVLISKTLYGNHGYKKAIYISLACPDIIIYCPEYLSCAKNITFYAMININKA